MYYIPTIISIIEVILILVPALLAVAYVTVAERKIMASMQRRLGPNAVGYYGSLQALLNRSYPSLEWALNSPPKPHAFVSLPLQSKNFTLKRFVNLSLLGLFCLLLKSNLPLIKSNLTLFEGLISWDFNFSWIIVTLGTVAVRLWLEDLNIVQQISDYFFIKQGLGLETDISSSNPSTSKPNVSISGSNPDIFKTEAGPSGSGAAGSSKPEAGSSSSGAASSSKPEAGPMNFYPRLEKGKPAPVTPIEEYLRDISDDEDSTSNSYSDSDAGYDLISNASVFDFKQELKKSDAISIQNLKENLETYKELYKESHVPAAKEQMVLLEKKVQVCNEKLSELEAENEPKGKGKGKAV